MDPAAEAVIIAATQSGTCVGQISPRLKTWRNITIEITNHSTTYTLANPRAYCSSGHCYHPPQPTIAKYTKEVCSFSTAEHGSHDVYGVLTYQILENEKGCVGELAIMFFVPYDYSWYKNWFALGIFTAGISCNYDLLNKMYYDSGPFTRGKGTGSSLTYSVKDVLVKGTMSAGGRAIMKVEFRDV